MPIFIKIPFRRMRKHPSFRIETEPVLGMKEGEVAIATYTSTADKMKVFLEFIREGLKNGDWVRYIYPDEEHGIVRAKLKEHGIDIEKYERNGTLLMKSLTKFYLPDGKFNKERSIQFLLNLRAEAKRKGYKHARELIDVGDFSFLGGRWETYLDYWDDPEWGSPGDGLGVLYEPFIIELTAINIGDMDEAQARNILKAFGGGKCPPTRFIDFLEHADAFSKKIELSHEKLLGQKFLLEFDPTSNYERAVEDFAKEAMANAEPIFIFTSSTSAVRTCLARYSPVKFFLMSVLTSTPESTSENEILLPSNNTPLILDSISRVLETYPEENVFLVFDSLSELVASIGLEKTYSFLRYVLDMLFSTRATAIFLLNTSAYEPEVASCLREPFRNQLIYRENQLKVIRGSFSEI